MVNSGKMQLTATVLCEKEMEVEMLNKKLTSIEFQAVEALRSVHNPKQIVSVLTTHPRFPGQFQESVKSFSFLHLKANGNNE